MEYYVKRIETRATAWARRVEAASEEEAREKFDEWFSAFGGSAEPDEEHVADVDYLVDDA